MRGKQLILGVMERTLQSGKIESLDLRPGVNVIVGEPNTGKTMWLRMIDFLLGSSHKPAEALTDDLAEKYDAIGGDVQLAGNKFRFERRWKERGRQGTIFVDEQPMTTAEAQAFVLDELKIPALHYPRGNPYSGQTWPELSFRELFRHIYRRQDCWTDLADKQADTTRRASLMHFLGLAEVLFTKEYGELVEAQQKRAHLAARKEQFQATLNDVARELLPHSDTMVAVTPDAVRTATEILEQRIDQLNELKEEDLDRIVADSGDSNFTEKIRTMASRRAELVAKREEMSAQLQRSVRRLSELEAYCSEVATEKNKLARAATADGLLADLRVTHCPACDQTVSSKMEVEGKCFLCEQPRLPSNLSKGRERLKFERAQVASELREAKELLAASRAATKESRRSLRELEEELAEVEAALSPARQRLSGLVQNDAALADVEIGRTQSRIEQLKRVAAAHGQNNKLTKEIKDLDKRIVELEDAVNTMVKSVDLDHAEEMLASGFNDYLTSIERERAGTWMQKEITATLSRGYSSILVGGRRWKGALGGTNTLYFLMAYHFALLRLSREEACHYPGLAIVDFPATLEGVEVRDKENFIVKPFVQLTQEFSEPIQVIFTGAAFEGLEGVNRIEFSELYV